MSDQPNELQQLESRYRRTLDGDPKETLLSETELKCMFRLMRARTRAKTQKFIDDVGYAAVAAHLGRQNDD